MNIGFIGAGKVGCSLGKYFAEFGQSDQQSRGEEGQLTVKGYYSIPKETSLEAAHFTKTRAYDNAEDLIKECDTIFITVPDGIITDVWNSIKDYNIKDKIICHCSGAMTSRDAFPDIEETGAVGYSVHPLFAVSDKYNTYRELTGVFFTIEGAPERMNQMVNLFDKLGNPVRIIEAENKTLYHCAAAVASNLVCGVLDMSFELMQRCGFTEEDARNAMASLIKGNVDHVLEVGTQEGLTGPVERNDQGTVAKHLRALEDAARGDTAKAEVTASDKEIYSLISQRLTNISVRRHPDRDYTGMYQLLEEGKK